MVIFFSIQLKKESVLSTFFIFEKNAIDTAKKKKGLWCYILFFCCGAGNVWDLFGYTVRIAAEIIVSTLITLRSILVVFTNGKRPPDPYILLLNLLDLESINDWVNGGICMGKKDPDVDSGEWYTAAKIDNAVHDVQREPAEGKEYQDQGK